MCMFFIGALREPAEPVGPGGTRGEAAEAIKQSHYIMAGK